jgi:uncharacterized repeat protein (TIGR03833 family)
MHGLSVTMRLQTSKHAIIPALRSYSYNKIINIIIKIYSRHLTIYQTV